MMEVAHYLVRLRSGYERDASYYLFQFNHASVPETKKSFYQFCCELCSLRLARIDLLFNIVADCADAGESAADTMRCINFFLYNQNTYDEINYSTYRQHSERRA